MPKPSFLVSPDDHKLILQIADRAYEKSQRYGLGLDKLDLAMTVTAVHANGCPLRLADLATADDFNFSHDVVGMIRHIDTNTGRLRNCFVPRFAQPEAA